MSPGPGEIATGTYLRALLDLTRLVRGDANLHEVLTAVAEMISETLGFGTVVVNRYRDERDDYEVTTVHGNERARAELLGDIAPARTWRPLLDDRFLRRGVYFIPAGSCDWDEALHSYTPELALAAGLRRRLASR